MNEGAFSRYHDVVCEMNICSKIYVRVTYAYTCDGANFFNIFNAMRGHSADIVMFAKPIFTVRYTLRLRVRIRLKARKKLN